MKSKTTEGLWFKIAQQIVGKVVRIDGGTNPHIQLKLDDGSSVIVYGNREDLAERKIQLFETIKLNITAEKNLRTKIIRRYRFINYASYSTDVSEEKLQKLRGRNAWEGKEPVDFIRQLRGDY